jgi:hypothetical protein
MQAFSFLIIEVVAAAGEHLIERHQLDLLTLGAICRLVEYEPPVPHPCLDRLHHRHRSLLRGRVLVEAALPFERLILVFFVGFGVERGKQVRRARRIAARASCHVHVLVCGYERSD